MMLIASVQRPWLAATGFLLVALLVNAASAETIEVAPGVRVTKKVYQAPANEQPFYGFVVKTQIMREADESFKAAILRVVGTPEKAFEESARRGWSAFFSGNMPEAARRFNQAYLFDAGQSAVFHAFGLIAQVRFNDAEYAEELLRVAREQKNPSRNLNADYGRLLLIMKRPRDAQPALERAVIDNPDFAAAWSNLGFSRQLNGDAAGACAAAAEASRRNPPPDVRSDLQLLRSQAKCN